MQLSLTNSFMAFVSLALSLGGTALAKDKNCRNCICTVNFGGVFKTDPQNLKEFMATACKKITGGDGYYMQTGLSEVPGQVGTRVWESTVQFYRLCGTSNNVDQQDIIINHYKEGPSSMQLNCLGCYKKVKCLGGSDCPASGLK